MIRLADGSIRMQTSSDVPCATPSWLGNVALVASSLRSQGLVQKICERIRFARRRFGRDDALDGVAVLFGSAISGERTDGGHAPKPCIPVRSPSLALCGRARLPAASTLSRF